MRVWSKNFTKGFGFKQEQCSYGQNTTYHCLHFNKQNADDENNPKKELCLKGILLMKTL